MIEKHSGQLEILCDSCETPYPTTYPDDDFSIMIADIKRNYWKLQKDGKKGWKHYCPDCSKITRK